MTMFRLRRRRLLLLLILPLFLFSDAHGEVRPPPPVTEMKAIQAAVIGIVEGLTEYLPVSSTGHIILAQRSMGIGFNPDDEAAREAADAFAICIQLGAILAVLGIFFGHVKSIVLGLFGRDQDGRRLLINVATGMLPAIVIGLALNELIKEYLFGLWPTVGAWFCGGLVILVIDRRYKTRRESDAGMTLAELGWKGALLIGLMQCIAMWPGTSRSLVTILGGLFVGLKLREAVIFSFILGMATLSAATAYDGFRHGGLMLDLYGPTSLGLGMFTALISAIVAVKWMVAYLNKHGMALFGYYRIALALVVAALLMTGTLAA